MTQLPYTLAVVIDTFNSPLLSVALLVVGTGLVFLTSRGHASALVLSSLLARVLGAGLKLLFAVPRLDSALVEVVGYRFPSQHALVAGAFFSSLCFSALCVLDSPYTKVLVVGVCLLAIIIVAWSRVFLHAHLPIDVIVGSLLGISISFVIHFLVLRKCYPIWYV